MYKLIRHYIWEMQLQHSPPREGELQVAEDDGADVAKMESCPLEQSSPGRTLHRAAHAP